MKYCTNVKCPALRCARQLIYPPEEDVRYEFEIGDDPAPDDLVVWAGGEKKRFACSGYTYGAIA